MRKILSLIFCALFLSGPLQAQLQEQEIDVPEGDVAALRTAIDSANEFDGLSYISIFSNGSASTPFQFNDTAFGSENALPDVSGKVVIRSKFGARFPYTLTRGAGMPLSARLLECVQEGYIQIEHAIISEFASAKDGAAVYAKHGCSILIHDSLLVNNASEGKGGALAADDSGRLEINNSRLENNTSDGPGGTIAILGSGSVKIRNSTLLNAGAFANSGACSFLVDSQRPISSTPALALDGFILVDGCPWPSLMVNEGLGTIRNSTFVVEGTAIQTLDNLDLYSSILDKRVFSNNKAGLNSAPPGHKPESLCEDSAAPVSSLGYNISSDESCGLDQSTDLPNTNPMLALNSDGLPVPQLGSPAIDAGRGEVLVHEGDTLASLPCDYVDPSGTARPQDGNNDGVYACDMGAMEAIGPGAVVDGHSGAFYNLSRDGEGTYVEILNDTTAIIYTFTYRPDGSGPAWFIGVAGIRGNSLIVDELLRPVGTSFGSGFNPNDIEFTPLGAMNMVFPNCVLAAPGGSVAYSGEADIGYEGVLTRATRLSNITGCGTEIPSPNAGLSGSYYDPARDGEGIIVEWLSTGDVLVVFFTYDENDNQLWLLGIGTPNGTTVTMDALYASTFTSWGRAFDADEVTISTWGSFTLTWTECGKVKFEYSSTVGNYGSGMHDYSRLSTLSGTACPEF